MHARQEREQDRTTTAPQPQHPTSTTTQYIINYCQHRRHTVLHYYPAQSLNAREIRALAWTSWPRNLPLTPKEDIARYALLLAANTAVT